MRRADVHCIPVQHVPTLRNEKLLNTPCKSVSRGCNDAMSVSNDSKNFVVLSVRASPLDIDNPRWRVRGCKVAIGAMVGDEYASNK